jgi:uncharacterized membrane protein
MMDTRELILLVYVMLMGIILMILIATVLWPTIPDSIPRIFKLNRTAEQVSQRRRIGPIILSMAFAGILISYSVSGESTTLLILALAATLLSVGAALILWVVCQRRFRMAGYRW